MLQGVGEWWLQNVHGWIRDWRSHITGGAVYVREILNTSSR